MDLQSTDPTTDMAVDLTGLPRIEHGTGITDEEAWSLAQSLHITPTSTGCGRYLGVVTAKPHPAGWFISARVRDDLSDAEARNFRDFLQLRAYLLLTQGPHPDVWERGADGTFVTHPADELAELGPEDLLPSTVSAGWR